MPPSPENACKWVDQQTALKTFATYEETTTSQRHIKPLHYYVACRLVLEGGFLPEDITPRPPFRAQRRKGEWLLSYDETLASGGEQTLLGGLKTKNVDVVVLKDGLGPVMSVSCKGAIGAFRNLTNRMEEAVGDCTNLHITYPAMVTGYLFVMRAHRQDTLIAASATSPVPPGTGRVIAQNDIAIQKSGEPVEAIVRFHNALRELTNRNGVRDDVSRYEAVSLALVDPEVNAGQVLDTYPKSDSPLRLERFFETLYLRYDERYVYSAPDLKSVTRRREWSSTSSLFDRKLVASLPVKSFGFDARIATGDGDTDRYSEA
jgi:hypothetical protein